MMTPLYLADDAFEMLALRIPNEILNGSPIANLEEGLGMTREQFAAFTKAITADGRSSGWADPQTATTLRNALALVLLDQNSSEFQTRVGYTHEEATELLTQLNTFLRDQREKGGE